MSGEGKMVAVRGASGFIASWLVKVLLLHGYTVKATVRDPNDPKRTEHLLALDGAKERLQLFKTDLLDEGSFVPVFDGCEGVFRTASPVSLSPSDPQAELIDPAVKGTLNILKSCTKFPSIRRVVVTSSIAAATFNGRPLTPDVVVDETWFSDPVFCEKAKLWYMLSKTLAEEAAWKFAKENRMDLVTINPGMHKSLSTVYRYIDVRDVASAHIQAFELSSANGRYILVERVASSSHPLKILRTLYPSLHLIEEGEAELPGEPTYQVSKEKAKSLGINFTSLELSLRDAAESLTEKGFLSF